ncbi:hypothetical protein L917_02942, partial [Phytophthora nicotianae]
TDNVDGFYVKCMRLRLLWSLLKETLEEDSPQLEVIK